MTLELPPTCELCSGNGRRVVLERRGGFRYGKCPACKRRGYLGPKRDLTTPVAEWAERVGFPWPEVESALVRGALHRRGVRLAADAIAGTIPGRPARARAERDGSTAEAVA